MSAELCEISELPADQCAHCKGVRLVDGPAPAALSRPLEAQHPGHCGHCDDRYPEGAEIVAAEVDGQRVWCIAAHTTGGPS